MMRFAQYYICSALMNRLSRRLIFVVLLVLIVIENIAWGQSSILESGSSFKSASIASSCMSHFPMSDVQNMDNAQASATWFWDVILTSGKAVPIASGLPSEVGTASLAWFPEVDASGRRLGWVLSLGDSGENLLIDTSIQHGPQPFEFFGWQFAPIKDGTFGLKRFWKLPTGTLRVLILDYSVENEILVSLRVRVEWFPAKK
ncbi:MAG: hypothetical protein HQM09_01520 [Candidatus Riflebacteria bacterium]|nr:hypothetical protein [Candidatus Riflebacteria bacterium]